MNKTRIAVLVSGNGSNLQAIINAIKLHRLQNAEVVLVCSDNPCAYGLLRAKQENIQTFFLDYISASSGIKDGSLKAPEDLRLPDGIDEKSAVKLMSRANVEQQLLEKMSEYQVDLLVCAGFMKVLTEYFLQRFQPDPFKPRIMNIHPALLPAFPGTDGYGDAFKHGIKAFGPTVHFVDAGIDTGAIIDQIALRRKDDDTLDSLKTRGLQAEHKLYVKCIRLFIEGRLIVELGPDGKRKVVRILSENP